MKTFKKIILTILFTTFSISNTYSMKRFCQLFQKTSVSNTENQTPQLPPLPYDIWQHLFVLSINLSDNATIQDFIDHLKKIEKLKMQYSSAAGNLARHLEEIIKNFIKIKKETKLTYIRRHEDSQRQGYPTSQLENKINKLSRLIKRVHPLHFAALMHNEFNYFEEFLSKGANPNNSLNFMQSTPLHFAAMGGNPRIVEHLLKEGVNTNPINKDGETPLYIAVDEDNGLCVQCLLQWGVETHMSKEEFFILFSYAVKNGCTSAVKALLDFQHFFSQEELIENVINRQERGPNGLHAALYIAAEHGFCDLAKVLLERNATVDIPDHYQRTPLMAAAGNGSFSVVELLLQFKANPNLKNHQGFTPFGLAQLGRCKKTMELLLQHGAQPCEPTKCLLL